MNKALTPILALMLAFSIMPATAATKTVITVYQETNFRASNSVNSDKVAVIKPPAKFDVVDSAKNGDGELWYKVKLNDGRYAWVFSAVVNVSTVNVEEAVKNQSLVLDAAIYKINIRSSPSKDSSIVATINQKQTFKIISKVQASDNSIWYKIQLDGGKAGWVISTVVSNFVTDQVKQTPVSGKVAIIDPMVNIRSLPSLDSSTVTRTSSTIRPQIVAESKDKSGMLWYQVTLPNGQNGWVRSDMARIDKPVSETPQKGLQVSIEAGTNIRKDAGTGFAKVTTISQTVDLRVQASKPDVNGDIWYKVSGTFGTGWVMASLVKTVSTLGYTTVNPDANLYVSPSKNANVITQTDKQFRCSISGATLTNLNETWYLVTLADVDKTGWVLSDNMKLSGNFTLPPSSMIGTNVEVKKETKLTSIPSGNAGYAIYSGGKGIVDAVAVRDKGQLFYRITTGGRTGWISAEFIRKSDKKVLVQANLLDFKYEVKNDIITFNIPYKGNPQDVRTVDKPNDSIVQLYLENSLNTSQIQNLNVSSSLVSEVSVKQLSISPAIVLVTFATNKAVESYVAPVTSTDGTIVCKIYPRSKDSDIKVVIQGKPVISQIRPYIKDAKPMIPLSAIKDTLGMLTREDASKTEYTLETSDTSQLVFRVGDPQADSIRDGKKNVFFATPATEKKNGQIFVPIEPIARLLGFKYDFNAPTRSIYLDPIVEKLDFGGCADKTQGCKTFATEIAFLEHYKKDIAPDGRARIVLEYAVLDPVAKTGLDPKRVQVTDTPRVGDKPPTVTILITLKENETMDVSESKYPSPRLIFMIKEKNKSGLAGKVIILDPGHGTIFSKGAFDGGCKSLNGQYESELALKITLKLRDMLIADGARVDLTRTEEKNPKNPDLDARISRANRSGADLYLSVHFGWSQDPSENGCKTYYYTNLGKKFAEILQSKATRTIPGDNMGSRFVGFDVCKNINSMPSVIIELMHLSNERASNWISEDDNVSRVAQAMYDSTKQYFEGDTN